MVQVIGVMAFMIGALIPTFLMSRLFLYLQKKLFKHNDYMVPNMLSLMIICLLYGFLLWNQNGGRYQIWVFVAIVYYTLPQFVWLLSDMYRTRKNKKIKHPDVKPEEDRSPVRNETNS